MQPLELHEDRFFDPSPSVRSTARELYGEVKNLPIVGPHGHVPPEWLAENELFPEPSQLIIIPDHYIFRMLYSQGVELEDLGIPRKDGGPVETDMRKVWQRFADRFYLFRGTPTGAWLAHELYEVFGVRRKLDTESAMDVYDQIKEKLQQPEFRPRAMFDRFEIEVLTTTDGATSRLEHHQTIRESDWDGRVLPCFRPDALFNITSPDWTDHINDLREVTGLSIGSYGDFIEALEDRRTFFKEMGATSTDHAVFAPYTHEISEPEADHLFQKALKGNADLDDEAVFQSHMLMEMARMSTEDGLVMQIHPGSFRDHNDMIYDQFGPDMGGDIPVRTEYTRNLRELLNVYGNHPDFTLVVFTLDETTYSRELAPLAGHYPAMRLGPPWWFHDSIEGMKRFRKRTTETAGIYNTAGFNDDTRAFPSIPARHDLCRRVDANYLAGLVERHIIDLNDARDMIHALSYGLVKDTYNL